MIEKILLGIIAVLLFGLIIALHEFGHFITAKLSGIRVNEFAVGMGPTLFTFTKGETKYSLRLFPIGGYCAMEGEDAESDDERAFSKKAVWKRMIVVSAGAIFNIILALLIMLTIVVQKPAYASTTIAGFTENSATQTAGLQEGDQFYKIDGYRIYTAQDMSFALTLANPDRVDIEVVRDGKVIMFESATVSSQMREDKKVVALDFKVVPIERNIGTVLSQTGNSTVSTARMVWATLGGLVTGRFGLNELSGPVGIVSAVSQVASEGLDTSFVDALNNILNVMMMISVNLGIVNLLPLPALDGGRLVFLAIEGIRRKPVPSKYEGWIHAAGFALLMVFMLVITFSDVWRLIQGAMGS